jgi:voltage-gated potassium channel
MSFEIMPLGRRSVRRGLTAEQVLACVGSNTRAVSTVEHRRGLHWLLSRELTARRAGRAIGAVTLVMTVLSGVLMWLADRDEFPNVWLGFWWAVQTVTTVGYGDVTPTTVTGRVIATVVMLLGIAFLTVVTAAITAVFIETTRRQIRAASDEDLSARLDGIAERLERIEAALADRRGGSARDGPP